MAASLLLLLLLQLVLTYDHGLSEQLAHQTDETGLSLLSLAALGGEGACVLCVQL